MMPQDLDGLIRLFLLGCNGNSGDIGIVQSSPNYIGWLSSDLKRSSLVRNWGQCAIDNRMSPKGQSTVTLRELENPNESGIVPGIPNVPGAGNGFAAEMFDRVFNRTKKLNLDSPPIVDDLTARCINRLGGWLVFCKRAQKPDVALLRAEFTDLMEEMLVHKSSGYYMCDPLPILRSNSHSVRSYRFIFSVK